MLPYNVGLVRLVFLFLSVAKVSQNKLFQGLERGPFVLFWADDVIIFQSNLLNLYCWKEWLRAKKSGNWNQTTDKIEGPI